MNKKYCSIIALFTALSLIISGCRDSSEVDDNVYAVSIGLDIGINNKVIVTVQYPVYIKGSGGENGVESGVGGNSNVHSVEAPAILEAIDLMNMAISRRVQLTHTKMLVISEDLAKQGIGAFLAPLARYRGSRRTMFIVVTKGKAIDFIYENQTNIGESITKSMELMMAQSKHTGFFPMENFHYFYRDILSNYSNAIAIYAGVNKHQELNVGGGEANPSIVTQSDIKPGEMPRLGTAKREFVGTAIFNGDKLVGSLNPYETRYMLIITNKFKKGIMTIEDKNSPGNGIIFSIRNGRATKVRGRLVNGKPVIDVDVNIEADINAIHSRINYESLKLIENLNKQLKEELQTGIEKTIEKTKNEYKSDIFGFGKAFAGYFPTIQEWEKFDWLSHYPDAKVNVNVTVNIRRTGTNIDSSPIQKGTIDE